MTAADRLDEIEARAEAATAGPWGHEPPPGPGEDPMRAICVYPEEDGGALAYVQPLAADAEFIAHARTDVPALTNGLESVLDYVDRCEESGITIQPGDIRRLIAAALEVTG